MRVNSKQSIRAILLDKDGTLVDFHATWMPATVRAAHALCAEHEAPAREAERLLELAGYDVASERCAPGALISGGTTRALAKAWDSALGTGDAPGIEAYLEALFEREVRDAPVAVDGLAEVLGRLRARGLTLGVATMDTERGAHATLGRLGIDALFDFVCGFDSGHGEKPGPGMVHAFCAASAVEPHEVAVVGDTTHDCAMGASAGAALVIGVLTGATGREALTPHCNHVLESVADLESVL